MKNQQIEDGIQKAIVTYLRAALPDNAVLMSIPNGALLAGDPKRRAMQMSRLKVTGLHVGAADLHICYNGRAIYMEVKSPLGPVQPSQKAFEGKITASGGVYAVVRSVDDAEAFLRHSCGVPLKATLAS